MPQLHFYVPDDFAKRIKARAARARLPVSRYLAELVKRDVGQDWPKGYFERISSAEPDAFIRHEPAGQAEERMPLE